MKSKKIIIIGGGGHAKVLIEAILSRGDYKIEGILDNKLKAGEKITGFPVIGGDEILERFKDFYLAIGIGSVKASDKRKVIYERRKRIGFEFPAIIHSNAYVSKTAILQDGVQVMAGAVINPEAKIGANTIVNTGAIVEHDCDIGPHCHISLNAALAGRVSTGECCHVGMGANVLQEIKIGSNVTVGAGAVVVKDVEDGKTVVGVPAEDING